MSRYTNYVINFSNDTDPRSQMDLSPFIISDFAEHMMSEIAGTRINHRPDTRSVMRQALPKVRVPTYKSEFDLGECSICQGEIKKGQVVCRLPCQNEVSHAFHKECIQPWLESNNSCPNCRSEF